MMQRYLCLECEYKVNDDGMFAEIRISQHVGEYGHKMYVTEVKAKEAA